MLASAVSGQRLDRVDLTDMDDDSGGLKIIGPTDEQMNFAVGSCQRKAKHSTNCLRVREREKRFCCQGSTTGKCVTQTPMVSEESEWEERRQQTGVAGRIVIYDKNENPRDDISFRDGGKGRIVVAMVLFGGKAWRAGVTSGDLLVSIDGKKDFSGLPASQVQANLPSPVVLVLLGFVGKLQAEVRLNHKVKNMCGLSNLQQVASQRQGETLEVVDEVVFECPTSPLFQENIWNVRAAGWSDRNSTESLRRAPSGVTHGVVSQPLMVPRMSAGRGYLSPHSASGPLLGESDLPLMGISELQAAASQRPDVGFNSPRQGHVGEGTPARPPLTGVRM